MSWIPRAGPAGDAVRQDLGESRLGEHGALAGRASGLDKFEELQRGRRRDRRVLLGFLVVTAVALAWWLGFV